MANANQTIDSRNPPTQPSHGTLVLNNASELEIAEIDMIGKKLAHAIVSERERRGGFRAWDELREVKGIDAMKLAELQRATRLD